MKSLVWFLVAAVGEIGGCFAFWMWLRLGKGAWPLAIGIPLLLLFAYALTKVEMASAGRTYAAYSAIYLASSLVWMKMVEKIQPDRWDLIGGVICLFGAGVIMFAPR